MLDLIWLSSLVFTLFAIIGMFLLITYRFFENKKEIKLEKRKKEFIKIVLECSDDYKKIPIYQKKIPNKYRFLLVGIARDLLPSVTGETIKNTVYVLTMLGGLDAILKQLNSKKEGQRIVAINVLAFFDYDNVVKALFEKLYKDDSSNVRLYAAISLHKLKQIKNLYDVLKAIFDNGSPSFLTFKTFMKKVAPEFTSELLEYTKSNNIELASLATEALGYSENLEVLPKLIEIATSNKNKEIRLASLRALWFLEHPKAKETIIKCLNDSSWEIRAQSAKCVGKIGLSEAIYKLKELLDDQNWWVRYRSAEALSKLGEQGLNILKDKIKYPHKEISDNDITAIIALATDKQRIIANAVN